MCTHDTACPRLCCPLQVVGASILFVYDDTATARGSRESARCTMIDFAKTDAVPVDKLVTHRDPWKLGNCEDGYLTGLDDLIDFWKGIASSMDETQ